MNLRPEWFVTKSVIRTFCIRLNLNKTSNTYGHLPELEDFMKHSLLRKYRFLAVAAVIAFSLAVLTACGGGGGSVDTSVENNPPLYSWWTGYDQKADTNVSVATLDTWIANGFKTDAGEPVVIIDISSTFGTDKTIPGSYKGADVGYYNSYTRDEGPLNASEAYNGVNPSDTTKTVDNRTAASMVLTGEMVDTILSKIGADQDTVIVFAQKTGINIGLARVWQMFYYWGFPESKLKILDGKVTDVATAAVSLNYAAAKEGTFSVNKLPQLHSSARATIKDVIQSLEDDSAIIWDSWGSHSYAGSKIAKNRFFYGQGNLYIGGAYQDPNVILDALLTAMIDPTNGLNTTEGLGKVLANLSTTEEKRAAAYELLKTKKIITHCQAGNAAAPAYYFAKELLPAITGNENVAMFDGSWAQWVVYTDRSPMGAVYAEGKFTEFNTTPYTTITNETTFLTYATKFWCREYTTTATCNSPVSVDMDFDGKMLNDIDKAYLEKRSTGSSDESVTNVGGGGGSC